MEWNSSARAWLGRWAEPGVATIDRAEYVRRAAKFGMPASEFERELDSRQVAEEHTRALEAAHGLGVFGIPSFVVGPELFWGNDRLVLLRDYLERTDEAG